MISAEKLLKTATDRVQSNWPIFGNQFPNYGDGQQYVLKANNNWVAGFWPGMVWQTFANTNDPALSQYAATLLPSFERRLDENIHINHDLGFLFTLSARAQHQLTGDEAAAKLALRAADRLLGRYRPKGAYIQAWGPVGNEKSGGQIIMDTMMNLPLLIWATEQTGDPRYTTAAIDHAKATATYCMREDGSTFHTYFFNQETGAPIEGKTHQGATDDSMWARGQAWGICGFAMLAKWFLDEPLYAATARKMAQRFMAENSEDGVPPWDFRLPANMPDYRDSSAGSIALCGLLRLSQLAHYNYKDEANAFAQRLFDGLVAHCWDDHLEAQGLLKHGAMHVPKGWSMDGYLIFGDYFMLEALTLLTGTHTDLWVPEKP